MISGVENQIGEVAGGGGAAAYRVAPKAAGEDGSPHGDLLEISMGPHHPSTHGVFRMDVVLDGEQVVKLKPVFGYLHRNHEKIGENTSYLGNMPYTDRLDYFCSMTNNWAYALTVEKLTGLQPPERAEYIRVIVAELTRLQNHTCLIGFLMQDMGALGTPLMYAFRERERIIDLFEALSGSRMMYNYMRFGGCRIDLPAGWVEEAKDVVGNFGGFLDEFERLLSENEIMIARTQGVGVLTGDEATNHSLSGPMLRASGVDYDVRKDRPYLGYETYDFDVPVGEHGDIYDRYRVRLEEMWQSNRILEQALDRLADLQGAPINVDDPRVILPPKSRAMSDMEAMIFHFKQVMEGVKPPAGEAYMGIENPKGELGYYFVSDGTAKPVRWRIRPPSFINLSSLPRMCEGALLADVIAINASVDIVMGEVDR